MEYVHGGDIYTYGKVLDFSVNVNPYGPSKEVLEAAKQAMDDVKLYPDSRCGQLRREIAQRKHLPEEVFLFGNGAAELFFTAVLAEKPKKALIPVPAFAEYEQALRTVNCEILYYELKEADQFALAEEFLDTLTEDLDLVFLCSPSNPAGQVIEPDLMRKILERCERENIRLVLDECFIEFLEEPVKYTMEQKVLQYSCLFLVQAFTKMHGIPGLRLGYGMTSDPEFRERMQQMRQPWSVSIPAQAAGVEALTEREEQRVLKTRQKIVEQRRKIEGELQKMGICVIPSEANFLLLFSELPLFELLLKQGILIRNCENYRGLGKGWYRVAVRTEEENEILLEQLRVILESKNVKSKNRKDE